MYLKLYSHKSTYNSSIAVSPLILFHHQSPSSYCEPFTNDENGLPIAPCGAVANSMFNGKHHC